MTERLKKQNVSIIWILPNSEFSGRIMEDIEAVYD